MQPSSAAARRHQLDQKVLPAAAVLAFLGVLVLYVAAVWLCGGSPAGTLLYPLAFVLVVLLPGLFLVERLLPAATRAECLAIAVPVGGFVLVASFALLGLFLPVTLCALPSVALGVCWLAGHFARLRLPRLAAVPTAGWWLVLCFAAALFLHLFCGLLPAAKAGAAGNMVYDQDMLWSIGNASAVRYGAPLRDIHAAGGVIHYHYLADVLCGLVAFFSGQTAWDAFAYFNWPIWAALVLLAPYLCSRRFGSGPLASLVAPVGIVFCHGLWDISQKHIFINVNGVLQNYGFLAAGLLVLQIAEQTGFAGKKAGARALVAIALVAGALVWSKSAMGVLFLCALVAAAVVRFMQKKPGGPWLLAAAGAGAAVFAVLYFFIFRHAINNLVFRPSWHAVYDAVRILAGLYTPALVLYVVSLVLCLRRFSSLSAAALALNAMVPGGVLAFILFYHYGFSQSYFLLAAAFCMWLCVGRLAGRLFARRGAAALVALVVAAGVGAMLWQVMPVMRKGVQIALRCAGLRPPFAAQVETITRDDAAAAAWLKAHMAPDEVFATNRNDRNPHSPGGLFHYYTAASDQQAYVEGWRCAMDFSMDYHQLRHNLEVVSDGIFACRTFEEASRLAAENGIHYLLMYLPKGAVPYQGGAPVFASDTVLIYRVEAAPGGQQAGAAPAI